MVKPGEKVVVKYTREDYLDFPDDGKRYEIIDGDLFVTPAPGTPHQRALFKLAVLISTHLAETDGGEVLIAPVDVYLDDGTIVQPDIVYVAKAHASRVKTAGIEGAPDMVSEMLSPSTAKVDRTRKLEAYAKHGVAHYWIVDPEKKTVEEYRLVRKNYELAGRSAKGATFEPKIFPGLDIPLDSIFG